MQGRRCQGLCGFKSLRHREQLALLLPHLPVPPHSSAAAPFYGVPPPPRCDGAAPSPGLGPWQLVILEPESPVAPVCPTHLNHSTWGRRGHTRACAALGMVPVSAARRRASTVSNSGLGNRASEG